MQTNNKEAALQAAQLTRKLTTSLNCFVGALAQIEESYMKMHASYSECMYGLGYEECLKEPESSVLHDYATLFHEGLGHIEKLKHQLEKEREWANSNLTWATAAELLEQTKLDKSPIDNAFSFNGICSFFTKRLKPKR